MSKQFNDICAGIVLYNPNLHRLKSVIDSIIDQVKELILVDNTSSNYSDLCELVDSYDTIRFITNQQNEGIAKALNQICSYGHDYHYDWCLTLDQDTICPNNMIDCLAHYCDTNAIGILCPSVHYEGFNYLRSNNELEKVYACMTSGSLTNLNAWEKVGGFNEDYFIDFVDNEFCMRLGLEGYDIIRVNACVMHHQLGELVNMKFLNLFPMKVFRHSPLRYYYMTRNNLKFINDYRKHLNVVKEYLKLAKILWTGLLFASDRKSTFSFIRRGFHDAHKGLLGKIA